MYRKIILTLATLVSISCVYAHEWTPTYPKWQPSFLTGIHVAKMELFNSRKEIRFYEISVFDKEWNPIKFSTAEGHIVQVSHLQRRKVEVYIRDVDVKNAEYICSRSKSLVDGKSVTFLASRICSKIK